jgi:dTDP-glucose 4,6-dehydratase
MTSNVLVTGGCGFIGSNFINIMKDKYPNINFINIDKLDYCSNVHNVKSGISTLIRGDVGNSQLMEHLIKEYNFDTVFHFAAQSHVDNSFDNALSFTKDNTHATHVLIEACRRYIPNVEFVHFSTDEVYGESISDIPFKEDIDILKPTNPYSASKAAAEMIVRSYIESFKMNIKIIRCNNVYGPNQYPEKLIPKFKKLLREGKKCTIHGKNCAQIKRAFMHIDDVVDAVEVVWKRGTPGEIYNIASEHEMTVMEVTQVAIETLKGTNDYDAWIEYVEDRPFNDRRYHICSKKLKALGWSQKRTMEDLVSFLRLQ